ncbi:uncharacterized protein Dyak_GE28762 [Drosophila yakuba]|uniref:Uncharacterized protein n=1 Tax=Drosophila yakuba TaxID=7245 RepID=A0A0R1EDQ3_DROYA|nr:uncharacterized protein Dyak_GE28762 [Drosophila yakuba]
MYFAIRLSFVLAMLFCLTGNGNARMQLQRRKVNDFKRKNVVVDGVSAQGGRIKVIKAPWNVTNRWGRFKQNS